MPVSPLNRDCDYRCDSCDALVEGEEVSNKFREAEIEAAKKVAREDAIKHMEHFLDKYETVFHPTNYIMLNIKMKLGCIYGNVPPGSTLAKMTSEEISRKMTWCQECLRVLDILDPGAFSESMWRSRLQREVAKCKFILQQIER